jgi:hypothetical protein
LDYQLFLHRKLEFDLLYALSEGNPLASIRILSWLQNPKAIMIISLFEALQIFLIVDFKIISLRDYLIEIFSGEVAVKTDVEVEGIFIPNYMVELKVIMV